MNWNAILWLVVVASLLVGCSKAAKRPASLEEAKAIISGEYVGNYNKGVERFILRTNGTFSQEFKQNGKTIYRNEGVWRVSEATDTSGYWTYFEPFTNQVEAIMGTGPIKTTLFTQGNYYIGERVLWFAREFGYYASVGAGGSEGTTETTETNEPNH